ncbi:tRNA epoxyqueuosine(34) reductase QueG [Clostridium sp.]|uniref:tRNA epoxyqueuosine(34) reductase QueG n=1 Tax=Clostridium sp. TaxID=1506 RepID=UPI002FC7409A
MEIRDEILRYCNDLGITNVGFTKCRVFDELTPYLVKRKEAGLENEFEEKDVEKRINPFFLMKEGKTIISIAFPYKYEGNDNNKYSFSKYTLGLDYHRVVRNYLDSICVFIEGLGGKALPFVDNNPLPERYIAYLSGVGFIGKNNNLITKDYGSYVFLAEIITDLEIREDKPIDNTCGDCELCMKSCPTHAIIKNRNSKDSNLCLSYITQKKHIDDIWLDKLGGRIFGCDTCQTVCPYNKNALNSNIEGFIPKEYMEEVNLKDLIFLSNSDFNEKFKKHSCGWRGKNILSRNALINYYNEHKEDKDNIEESINSPYVKEYYDKLFKKEKS